MHVQPLHPDPDVPPCTSGQLREFGSISARFSASTTATPSDQGGAVSVSAGNVAIRLASPEQLTGLASGSVIVLRTADGAATRYTVSDVTTVGSSAAAELVAAAPLVVLAHTAPDEWLTISAA